MAVRSGKMPTTSVRRRISFASAPLQRTHRLGHRESVELNVTAALL